MSTEPRRLSVQHSNTEHKRKEGKTAMSQGLPVESNLLHLPNLSIKGFRGLNEITFPRLGRITLFAGRNSVGKTTVLEAVHLFAARGRLFAIESMLRKRGEVVVSKSDNGDETLHPELDYLFYGRQNSAESVISIGSTKGDGQLRMEITSPSLEFLRKFGFSHDKEYPGIDIGVFRTEFNGVTNELPLSDPDVQSRGRMYFGMNDEYPQGIQCEFLGPNLSDDEFLAQRWDNIALTDNEEIVTQALNLIFDNRVERVAVIGGSSSKNYRRVVVRMMGGENPVPLRSLGDGAMRLFTVAVTLAVCRNGFLLIDEAENGLHFSIHRDFWKMVLKTAQKNNIQVFATTHSSDCVKGFEQAISEDKEEEVPGIVISIRRRDGRLRAIEYAESKLKVTTEQNIELR